MSEVKQVTVPDIGDFDGVPVIEVLIKVGDTVAKDDGLVTLESDKATMEVPAPFAGTVREVKVSEGDEVAEGDLLALIEPEDGDDGAESTSSGQDAEKDEKQAKGPDADKDAMQGEESAREDAGKKAQSSGKKDADQETSQDRAQDQESSAARDQETDAGRPSTPPVPFDASVIMPDKTPHASPAVRAFARELGVDIGQVEGSGRKGRIQKEDVQAYVKKALARGAKSISGEGAGLDLLPWPKVDFSKFGEVEEQKLSRIQKIAGRNLSRNWVMIPHVTQHDQADITEMEAFRKKLGRENENLKITPLVFLIKAAVAALKEYPRFNASLKNDGETLVVKKYFHIGIAVDTPDGLVVPVLRDCDQKGLLELARELGEISSRARDGKLAQADMSGGCFSISSLGGIGGTAFTPIVNAPEVAILGVSRSAMQPVWNGEEFEPRLMLPLSLSYDHRVIDGAAAARFAAFLAKSLGDIRRLLL
ncbi:MAG: dihydrolipoyllysine-residue acetyltransferase [Rhodanobacteraceae bacterium]